MSIAYDIDGVIAKTYEEVAFYIKQLKNKNLYIDPISYKFKADGISEREISEIIDRIIVEHSEFISPYEDVKNWIHDNHRNLFNTNRIKFITARPRSVHEYTVEWINKHFSDFDVEVISCDSGYNKYLYLKEDEYFVEDSIDNAIAIVGNLENIKKIFILKREWNSYSYLKAFDEEFPNSDLLKKIVYTTNIQEIEKYIKGKIYV
jgi:uncharacterized HAD superfamily protein